jgi:hypothetical protein
MSNLHTDSKKDSLSFRKLSVGRKILISTFISIWGVAFLGFFIPNEWIIKIDFFAKINYLSIAWFIPTLLIGFVLGILGFRFEWLPDYIEWIEDPNGLRPNGWGLSGLGTYIIFMISVAGILLVFYQRGSNWQNEHERISVISSSLPTLFFLLRNIFLVFFQTKDKVDAIHKKLNSKDED